MRNLFKQILWNGAEHRLRAPVRLILQLLITILSAFVAIVGIGSLLTYGRHHGMVEGMNKQTFDQLGNMVIAPFAASLIILSLKFGARRIDRRNFTIYGVTLSSRWMKQFTLGFVLATALMTLIFAAEYLAGWIHVDGYFTVTETGNALTISFAFSLVKFVTVGICEELLFRGLVLRNFVEGFTGLGGLPIQPARILALLLSALLFGAVHLTNPNSGMGSTAGIFFIGIFFGLGYIATGNLAIPMGLHMAWNLVQGTVYGFPVSGDKEPASFLLTHQTGNVFFTGGNFGPEAGLVGIAAAILGILILLGYCKTVSVPAIPVSEQLHRVS